jgi:hypothetical protein
MDGSAMGEEVEAAEEGGEAGVVVEGVMAAGGGAGVAEEARLEPDTRLSRAWTPKVGGP